MLCISLNNKKSLLSLLGGAPAAAVVGGSQRRPPRVGPEGGALVRAGHSYYYKDTPSYLLKDLIPVSNSIHCSEWCQAWIIRISSAPMGLKGYISRN